MCYLNNYGDTQSIVAEFKKFKVVRYSKEIGRMSPSQKLTKLKSIKLRIASNRSDIIKNPLINPPKNSDFNFGLTGVDL